MDLLKSSLANEDAPPRVNVPALCSQFGCRLLSEELASVRGLRGASAGGSKLEGRTLAAFNTVSQISMFLSQCMLDFKLAQLDFLNLEVAIFCVTSSPGLVCLLFDRGF